MNGFYLMHRGWLDHPVLQGEPYDRRSAWAWLIEEAKWQDRRCDIAGHIIQLKRGQLSHSTRFMGRAWGWSEARVRRFLTRLKIDAMIDAETDAGRYLLTIRNYEKYQAGTPKSDAPSDAPSDAAATQQRRKPKEGKESKEKNHTVASLADEQFEVFWRAYPSRRNHSNPKKPARAKFVTALKRGVAAADIIRGAENYAAYVEREGTDPKYVPQAQTWLHQERWAQYQEAAGDNAPTPIML